MLSTIGCIAQRRGYPIFVPGNPMGTGFVEWNHYYDGIDAQSAGYITDDYVKMDARVSGLCSIISKSAVDFSKYSKAKIEFNVSMQAQQSPGFTLELRLHDSQPVVGAQNQPEYSQFVRSGTFLTAGIYEVELDISNFTATKYPGLFAKITDGGGYVDIYKWRLL